MNDEVEEVTDEVEVEPVERSFPDDALLSELVATSATAEYVLSHGDHVVMLPSDELLEFGTAAKAAGFDLLADVTSVDYLGVKEPRFEVVVNLLNLGAGHRIRIRCAVDGGSPSIASLVSVYPGANFFEREVYDLMGIEFDGHPDLTRILMPDDWEGHPLRKDFGVGSVPVQFKASNKAT